MKGVVTCILWMGVFVSSESFAQELKQGIYLSASDFESGKIAYSKTNGKRYKIRLHENFRISRVTILIGDSIITLHKDSVFGYRDAESTTYRFYQRAIYRILNPGEKIVLYSQNALGGYKGTQQVESYFFSSTTNSPLIPLSLWSLKKAFPKATKFHELLDLYFKYDSDLLNYSDYDKMYQLNHVYQLSQHDSTHAN